MKDRDGDQVLPTTNDERYVQHTFIERIVPEVEKRGELGIERYGTLLQPFNGRDYVQDAWEEFIDLGVYLEGLRRERDAMIDLLMDVATNDSGKGNVHDRAAALLMSMGVRGGA